MSVEPVAVSPSALSSRERSQQVSRALADAARRLRFASQGRGAPGGHRARRSRMLGRAITFGGFLVFVAIPTLVTVVYYGLIASDQYESEARFAVRGGVLAGLDPITALVGIPAARVIQDTQLVVDYIHSRAAIDELQKTVDIRGLYSREEADWWARLNPHKPVEKLMRYWEKMTDLKIEMPGGIVHLDVRAFRPEDAVLITRAVMAASEKLVNDLNDRSRRDAVSLADQELALASTRLAQARADLEVARNREGVLDASAVATSINTIISTVRTQQLGLKQQQEAMLAGRISPDAPQMRDLRLRIEAADRQIEALQRELTNVNPGGGDAPLSGTITRLSDLNLRRQIAETQYASAAAALERARIASLTKQIYLTSFVQPVAAEQARYPKRGWMCAIVLGGGLLLWGGFAGLASLARNHMA